MNAHAERWVVWTLCAVIAVLPVILILEERLLRILRKPVWDRRLNPVFIQKLDQLLAAESSYQYREAVAALDMELDDDQRSLYLRLPEPNHAMHVRITPDRTSAQIYWTKDGVSLIEGPYWYRTTDSEVLRRIGLVSDLLARLPPFMEVAV